MVCLTKEENMMLKNRKEAASLDSDNAGLSQVEHIVSRPASATKKVQSKKLSFNQNIFGHLMRTVMLDLPVFFVLLTYAAVLWFSHVHDLYLVPQLKVLTFTLERSLHDLTYYTRVCDASDMSTMNGADLFLPMDATPRDAYLHQLKHGFTVFPGILKPETCEKLRNFIVKRNHEITEEESIFVIAGENRYSFGLGTEEVSVREALMELGNSPRLRPALEEILGPDPALIELTAITTAHGAVAQWWHNDVVAKGSPVQFGRAFGPSYSVFVQLQNTTKAMGATAACPGTHYCAEGSMAEFCDEIGFQVVGENGYWGQGDALLMNMNSWHRGGAHTDPSGIDRVMLILTFVPKPLRRAETRQLSQGITFSLRWDMWGHTLNDLAHADTAMTQPWATLRALGLYKKREASWGIDYIISATIRTANEDNGFRPDELDTFLHRGGFPFLPNWLENFDIDWDVGESWPEYIQGTKELCKAFFAQASFVIVGSYLILFSIAGIFSRKRGGVRHFFWASARLLVIGLSVIILYISSKSHVDQSGWAADILNSRRYTSTVENDRIYAIDYGGPSTYPTKYDVLIETRYGSDHLAMYNDYIPLGHPGNQYFQELINMASIVYNDYGQELKNATVHYLWDSVTKNRGRFLCQGPDGLWMWMDPDKALDFITDELRFASDQYKSQVNRISRRITSNYKYGEHRNTALSIRHSVPYMDNLQKLVLRKAEKKPNVDPRPKPSNVFRIFSKISPLPVRDVTVERSLHVPFSTQTKPPYAGAWLAEDDEAETFDDGIWYYAVILVITGRGDVQVRYADGSIELVDKYSIRPFVEYRVGEQLWCHDPLDGNMHWCTVLQVSNDGLSYNATVHIDGRKLSLKLGELRRSGDRLRKKFQMKGPSYHDM
jgi:Phytanoyl-CoA dioxygenase (PhyH)